MRHLLFLLGFLFSDLVFAKECDVNPCSRDVIVVVDGSTAMQTTTYVSEQIRMVLKFLNGWTLSETGARVALVGAYFGNEFLGGDYYTDSSLMEKNVSVNFVQCRHNMETTRFIDERYVYGTAYGTRLNTMKRIIIFTAMNDPADIVRSAARMQKFKDSGFQVSIVGIGSSESSFSGVPYHKFFGIPFVNLDSPSDSFINLIINDGVCFWDDNFPKTTPHNCPTRQTTTIKTTTRGKGPTVAGTTKTTTRAPPTHPPFPVGDYRDCGCNLQDLFIDIVFLVDNSLAMGDGLQMIKAEINSLVATMSLDPQRKKHAQVGIITYNNEAKVVFEPSAYTDEDEFTEDLWETPLLQQASDILEVNLQAGLIEAGKMIGQMRVGVKKTIVIYASAYNDEDNDPKQAAAQLKEGGVEIITVAFVQPQETTLVLKMGELASPRMNFTSYRDRLLVEELEDAFCQVNCYCPIGWSQLVLNDRKYGECYFETMIDANWKAARPECGLLGHSGSGHLVYINSGLKQKFLNDFAVKKWTEGAKERPNYDIGLYFNATFNKYVWVNGVTDPPYFNWAINEPNSATGECVKAVLKDDNSFAWETVNCVTDNSRGLCQEMTCDTDFYCDGFEI
ncbi:unnamed protein product [Caenorhabditis auriculariae]|uniref:C-type lectin domain-containing protein n=1 Tax=Caenorhabditis auriculariae TaxID=2777116 RepID=A0A8S1HCU7_9PELO|nr:unnamed protein product [Caenorhabditis auriculariae]